jgi:hypothetical protein
MDGLIDPFYERAPSGSGGPLARGEIWDDQPIYLPARWALRVTQVDPLDDTILNYELGGRSWDAFSHPPITRPQLPNREALVVGKAKWGRPVIVLADQGTELLPGPGTRPIGTVMCAPVYGSDQLPPELVKRVRAYEFPNLFYLPQTASPVDEGFARFDHIQGIRQSELRRRRSARLSTDALSALEEWLIHYLTGRLARDSLIDAYRREELAKLRPAPPPTAGKGESKSGS